MEKIDSNYLPAMQAYNDFFEMLYSAIKSVEPEIELSKSAAYVWRSYRIDKYKDFATCTYYFNIYAHEPRKLALTENFFHGGKPYNQDIISINLEEDIFFNLDKNGQMAFLENFVRNALADGELWQGSKERKLWVPEAKFHGTHPSLKPKTSSRNVSQISDKFLLAMPMQDYLFAILAASVKRIGEAKYSRRIELRPNMSWFNWDFRGYRMWICNKDGSKPSGPCEHLWRIYLGPAAWDKIYFERNDDEVAHLPIFTMDNQFLNSTGPEQETAIDEFVQRAFESQHFRLP